MNKEIRRHIHNRRVIPQLYHAVNRSRYIALNTQLNPQALYATHLRTKHQMPQRIFAVTVPILSINIECKIRWLYSSLSVNTLNSGLRS